MDVNQRRLMDKPSIETKLCPFCGRPIGSRHHIVPRSQGGTNGPTITVCGYNNVTGCHGRLHQHTLHLNYNEKDQRWEYLHTTQPTKDWIARTMGGWLPLGGTKNDTSIQGSRHIYGRGIRNDRR